MTSTRVRLAPEERRQQIIAAARPLYARLPFDEVSTEDLAQAAGVARGLIHHYFGDKRGVFLAVMRESILMPEQAVPVFTDESLEERIRVTMDWILEAATTYGQAWVSASGAVNLHGSSDVQAIVDEADDRAARLVLDTLGLADDERLRARVRPMATLTKAVCREWLERGLLTREEALDLLSQSLMLGVAPAHPSSVATKENA